MSIHRIRLVGPWEFAWQHSAGDAAPETLAGSVAMPCDWQTVFGFAAGVATFSRRFHRPTNLDSHEQVVIVLTGVGGTGSVSLNGNEISQIPSVAHSVECDVTRSLLPFNVLEVTLQFHPNPETPVRGGLFDPVVLEIRSSLPM